MDAGPFPGEWALIASLLKEPSMKTEVSSSSPISDEHVKSVVTAVESGLSHFRDRLTRAEVHLKFEGAGATGYVECLLEVRPAGRDPVVAKDHSSSADDAVGKAVEKMERLLTTAFGKSDSHKGGPSASGLLT